VKTTNSQVAIAVLTAIYGSSAFADDASTQENGLQEVVVTATRRAVSAQDLPISITAVTGASLEQGGIQDIADLARSMAGVNVTDKGPFGGVNGSTLIIRGLNSEATAGQLALATPVVPPVATYVDDTPLFVSLRLQDLDRVEVLRGPQGTLYGSGSLGGTIRFVQNAPDPRGFDAKVEVGASDTSHTHEPNEDVNGMLNFPISDTFAIRLNGSLTNEAGFINQPNLYRLDSAGAPIAANPSNYLSPPVTYSQNGVNDYGYRTGRIAALWKPTDEFHAQLSYYYQHSTAGGFPYAAPLYGVDTLQSSDHTLASTDDKVNLAALTAEYEMGFATLTSNTSWAHHVNHTSSDLTNLYSFFSFYPALYGANPRVLVTGHDELDDKPWSQEFRLASKTGGAFDWVGGLFFKHQTTNIQEHEFYNGYLDFFNACAAATGGAGVGDGLTNSECGIGETAYTPGNPPNSIEGVPIIKDQAYIGDFETTFKDEAIFGEATYHATEAWSITGGTRVFKQTVQQAQQTGLLFDGVGSIANVALSDSWRRALWKINTAYQLDKTNLVYATWSQGFRRGGVNALPASEPAVGYTTPPALYKLEPDKADNYEVGIKGTVENRFRYSAAIYDIQWHNVQEGAQLTPLVLPGAVNVGSAYSRGVETELFAAITDHFTAQLDYTYDKTALTSIAPLAAEGVSVPLPGIGAQLPGTPTSSAALTFEYGHVELAGGELRYAISGHYQSSLVPALSATIPRVGGYTMLDTRLSFTRSHWIATAYVNNLTNQLGVNSYSDPFNYGPNYQAVVSTPRTVGVTLGYSFKEH
jgi:outer membrane receptor protein involved in Fe transport